VDFELGALIAGVCLLVSAVQRPGTPPAATTLLLGAINEMIAITGTRQAATQNRESMQ
jgi:hypothetical protein